MINLQIYRTIAAIDAELWDRLAHNDWFHRHRFIASVEEAALPGAQFWYLLFMDDEKLVGSAVLSTYSMSLDMFIRDHSAISTFKSFFPSLFTVRLLMCGLPASFGQFNCKMSHNSYAKEISKHIREQLEAIARREKISFLFVKELLREEAQVFRPYFQDYILANSIPYMQMDIRWTAFTDYLAKLRYPYRRSIKNSLKMIGVAEPLIYQKEEINGSEPYPVLQLDDISGSTPHELYHLYLSVMERTSTKLEILNLGFFEALFRHMRNDIFLLKLQQGPRIFAVALLLREQKQLTFMLLGRGEEKDPYDSYFNLIYGILSLAMQWRMQTINMGQTAYWVKQRVGALPKEQFFFLRVRNRILHFLIKKLNPHLFPQTSMPEVKIFHHDQKLPQHV